MGKYNQIESSELVRLRVEYAERIRALHLKEGWNYDQEAFETRPYWPLEPRNDVAFHRWAWKEIGPLIREAKEMVQVGRGTGSYDRRVVSLCNPGLAGRYAATATLFADIQLLTPGEDAPCHRHTPIATRFIMQGEAGWTNVEGDRVSLTPGDILYCGPNYWHDHKNEGSNDLIFLDVLDIPLLQYLGVSEWYFDYSEVSESKDDVHHPRTTPDDFEKTHGKYVHPWARPRFEVPARKYDEIHHFRWEEVREVLMGLEHEKGSPTDGVIVQFQNPHTHNPVGPTVDICSQMIRPGEETMSHRHTWATVCICVEGAGEITVGEETQTFEQWDIFVIPGWAWHSWKNRSDAPCFVHSISDFSVMERLGFAREDRGPDGGGDTGWQPIPFTRVTRD